MKCHGVLETLEEFNVRFTFKGFLHFLKHSQMPNVSSDALTSGTKSS